MDLIAIPGVNNYPGTFSAMGKHLPPRHSLLTVECEALSDVDQIAAHLLADAPSRFVVLGHSFGGHVALAMAAAAAERFAGLALINSADWADSDELKQLRETRAEQAERGSYQELADAASARAYHPSNTGRADLLEERKLAIEAYGPIRFAAHQRAMAKRPDRRDMLLVRQFPLLVIAGDSDVVLPTSRQIDMAAATGAEHVIIPQAGHMLPAEQPAALAAALTQWLDLIDTNPEGV